MSEVWLILYGVNTSDEAILKKIADGAFNIIHTNSFHQKSNSTRQQLLDRCGKYGLKLMPWYCGFGGGSDKNYDPNKSYRENINYLRAKAISDFDADPNLWGWMLWDEPDMDWDAPSTRPEQIEVYNEAKGFGAAKPLLTLYDQADWERGGFSADTFDVFSMDAYKHMFGRTNEDALNELDTAIDQRAYFFRKAAELGKPFVPCIQAYVHEGDKVVYGSLKQQLQVYEKYMPCSGVWYYDYPQTINDPILYEEAKALNLELGGVVPPPLYEDIYCPGCQSLLRVWK